jgi:hypothetical protein
MILCFYTRDACVYEIQTPVIAACSATVERALHSLLDSLQASPVETAFNVYPGEGAPDDALDKASAPAAGGSGGESRVAPQRQAGEDLYVGSRVFDLLQAAVDAVEEERVGSGEEAGAPADGRVGAGGEGGGVVVSQGEEVEVLRIVEIQVVVRIF